MQLKINGSTQNDSLAVAVDFNDYFKNDVLERGQNFTVSVNGRCDSQTYRAAKNIFSLDAAFPEKRRNYNLPYNSNGCTCINDSTFLSANTPCHLKRSRQLITHHNHKAPLQPMQFDFRK